jgi:tripartite-type tricarboxylate transporter receptor subunit TctC
MQGGTDLMNQREEAGMKSMEDGAVDQRMMKTGAPRSGEPHLARRRVGKLCALALAGAAASAVSALAAPTAHAQAGGTTRIVVAFPPGGPVDLVARTIADELGKALDSRVIVENKAGANGAIGAEAVARAEPDGQTLWLTSVGAVAINPSLYAKLPYDMARDFAPVSLVVNNVEVMVVSP